MRKLNRVSTALLLFTLFSSVTLSQQATAPATASKLLQLKNSGPFTQRKLTG